MDSQQPSGHEASIPGATAGETSAVDEQAAASRPWGIGELSVTGASLDQWRQVAQWAAEEQWNPGLRDTDCFHPTDPAGFFIGRLDGRLVSAISVVTYSREYAFLGYYLVHPDLRRRGLGLATWRAAVPHAGDRTIGLDAVPEQQATYERSGFTAAYRSVRWGGRPQRAAVAATAEFVPVTAAHLDEIAAFDRQCFPAERRDFLGRWLATAGHTAYACLRDGAVTGYGVIRPAHSGERIGPLFADTADEATLLFDALTAHLGPDDEVFIDVPESHDAANALVSAHGLTPGSHTVRMYNGPVPAARGECTYGVTSLELG